MNSSSPVVALVISLAVPSFAQLFNGSNADPEAVGRAALKAGRLEDALSSFMRALQALPPSGGSSDTNRLRREILEAVQGMKVLPPIPAEARRHLENAKAFDEARNLLGPAGPSPAAIEVEIQAALTLAPWWSEALLKLADTQRAMGRGKEADETLGLYQFATTSTRPVDPIAPAVPTPGSVASSGSGTIMVYWPKQFKGAGRPKIKCDGARVADLAKGRYIRISAEAGLHEVAFYNDTTGVRVLPGVISYLRVAAVGFPARAEVREVPAAEAESEMMEKAGDLNEADKTYSETCGVGKK